MSWRDLFHSIGEKLESFRQLIDVEEDSHEQKLVAETLETLEQSRAERLLQKIAQSVDAMLAEEIIRTPSGKAFAPEKFVVFLNSIDDAALQGRKREFVRQELAGIILDEARRRAGQHQLTTERIEIEFRLDATLAANELRVSAVLADESELTVVTDNEKTVVYGKHSREIRHEAEAVLPSEPLFSIEVWQHNKYVDSVRIYKSEAVIGRGTSGAPADIQLSEAGVSRRHAVIEQNETGEFSITHIGANPTAINGVPVEPKQKTVLKPFDRIEICDFVLSINA